MINYIFETLATFFEAFIAIRFILKFQDFDFKRRGNLIKYICVSIGSAVIVMLMNNITSFEGLFGWIYVAYFFVVSMFFTKKEIFKKLFSSLIGALGVAVPPIVIINIFMVIFKQSWNEMACDFSNYNTLRYPMVIVAQLFRLFLYDAILRVSDPDKMKLSKREWGLIISVFTFCFTSITFINVIARERAYDTYSILFLITDLCMAVTSLVCFYMTILLNKANKRSEEYKLRSQQNEFNIQYAENIRKQYDEIRLIRHDIKQNYAVLEGLLNEGKTQSALEYIQKQTDILAKNTVSVKLGNDRINSLIGSKLSFAKSSGVEVICSSNGNLSGIDDADLCTLLGNILDNAVEGCRNSSSDHKFIEIKLVGDEDKISVAVSNSAAPNSIENINKLKTTKENAEIHGFGIKSIRKIAEKYGGSASYEQVGDVITCHVLLYK